MEVEFAEALTKRTTISLGPLVDMVTVVVVVPALLTAFPSSEGRTNYGSAFRCEKASAL